MVWTLPVEEDSNGEQYITFPDNLLKQAGWEEGDYLEWIDNGNGSFTLKKVEDSMEKSEKRERALTLFTESVLKPDQELRQCAHNQECFHEFMEWREEVLEFLKYKRQQEFS